jgi:SAM-dependent methyltransferase
MGTRALARRHRVGAHVVVRDGPRGRELLVDGTFASFYRPGEATTGSVWDALAAPLLALPAARRRRVLVIGLGGGSAARVVRALAPRAEIVGVELDAQVVAAARRWFDLDSIGVEVVIADAREYLERERRRFDAVLDDVFIGPAKRVRKPDWLPEPGLRLAAARIAPGGVLSSNAIDEARAVSKCVRTLLGTTVSISIDGYHNRILAGGAVRSAGELRRAIRASAILAPTLPKLRLRTLSDAMGGARPDAIRRNASERARPSARRCGARSGRRGPPS